jgi:hypothetical protein
VLDGGRINLKVAPEVSDLNKTASASPPPACTPPPSCPPSRRAAPPPRCSCSTARASPSAA